MEHLQSIHSLLLCAMNTPFFAMTFIGCLFFLAGILFGFLCEDYRALCLGISAPGFVVVLIAGISAAGTNKSQLDAITYYLESNNNYVPMNPLKDNGYTHEMKLASTSPDDSVSGNKRWTELEKKCPGITVLSFSRPKGDETMHVFVHPGKPDGECKNVIFRADAGPVFLDFANFLVQSHQDSISEQASNIKTQFENSDKLK